MEVVVLLAIGAMERVYMFFFFFFLYFLLAEAFRLRRPWGVTVRVFPATFRARSMLIRRKSCDTFPSKSLAVSFHIHRFNFRLCRTSSPEAWLACAEKGAYVWGPHSTFSDLVVSVFEMAVVQPQKGSPGGGVCESRASTRMFSSLCRLWRGVFCLCFFTVYLCNFQTLWGFVWSDSLDTRSASLYLW